jgi:hypothetical protein
MADTPAPGKKFFGLSKNQAIIVAIGGAGVVFLVYRHYQSANSAAASTNSAADTSADIDPETGYAYGSAQDTAALAALNDSGTGALDDSGVATDSEPYYSTAPTTQSPTTNAAWSQYVQQQLATIGYDPETVAGAIGAYLAQIPLTPTQAGIVQVALAECGPPPQGEYSIIPQGTGSGTGTGTGTTTPTSGGPVTVAPTGFRVVSVTGNNVNLAWNPVAGATGYVIAYGPTSGSQAYKQGVGGGSTSAATVAGVGAGSAGKHYFELWATPASANGPHAGPIEATTTK